MGRVLCPAYREFLASSATATAFASGRRSLSLSSVILGAKEPILTAHESLCSHHRCDLWPARRPPYLARALGGAAPGEGPRVHRDHSDRCCALPLGCAPGLGLAEIVRERPEGVGARISLAKFSNPMSWACPQCKRTFRQVHQRHACGAGNADTLLKGRPPALADLYRKLETAVKGFGDVEVVTGDRYALFRTTRIFADLTVMRDALRVVVHLGRKVGAPCFVKTGKIGNRISHVALVRTAKDLRTIIPFLREAFDLALSEETQATP